MHSCWGTLSVSKRREKCFFPFVRVIFSPWGDKRRGSSSAVRERRQSVLPTPASGMLVSVRLCAHSQLEPRCCLSHSAGRECQLCPLTTPQSTTILLPIYKDALAHLSMFLNRSLLMQTSFYFSTSSGRSYFIITCPFMIFLKKWCLKTK